MRYLPPWFEQKLQQLLTEERLRGKAEENKEWRKGNRCHICGGFKKNDFADMCSKCFEEQ